MFTSIAHSKLMGIAGGPWFYEESMILMELYDGVKIFKCAFIDRKGLGVASRISACLLQLKKAGRSTKATLGKLLFVDKLSIRFMFDLVHVRVENMLSPTPGPRPKSFGGHNFFLYVVYIMI